MKNLFDTINEMNGNELYLVKEYNFDNSLIEKIDSIIDNCIGDCYKN